jgi:hypothetical protein
MTGPLPETSLLEQAARLTLLGLLFERPTTAWREKVERLAAEIRDDGLCGIARKAAASTEGSYLAMLGPGGRVSPREVYYRGAEDPGSLLADVSAFYRAFAYAPKTEEPTDHVAVEVGFLGYLRLKEAYAASLGMDEAVRTTREAFERFAAQHLRIWSEPLSRALARAGAGSLEDAGQLLVGLVGAVAEPAGTPEGEEAEPFSCAGMNCEDGCGIERTPPVPFEL